MAFYKKTMREPVYKFHKVESDFDFAIFPVG